MANFNNRTPLANSLKLFTEIRRYISGISPLRTMLSSDFLCIKQRVVEFCLLITSSSPTRFQLPHFWPVPRALSFAFGLLWILISYFSSVRAVYVRFFILLAWPCARDFCTVKTNSEMDSILCSRALRVQKNSIQKTLEGTIGICKPSGFISL